MAIDIRVRPAGMARTQTVWQSTIGKKAVMAATGLIMVLFLLVHMLGNLKIFFGPHDFDGYAGWLRTIGEPVLHGAWFLWIQRVVLFVALVLHVTCAVQLSRRDLAARPTRYAHGRRAQATFATRTMRWGGAIIALFLVWHILDLTAGVTNPDFDKGSPYHNVVADFQVWWINLVYFAGVLAIGLHINHGFWSATRTLGLGRRPGRDATVRAVGSTLAVVITLGFLSVPIGVMTGLVR
ncbi:MAG TPA: succinate dehydrogenase cytochrome b subunit [Actinospica sp.]|nr:succinate dehydrogenase cytochrome b subunit [Actinospica sp.]